MTETGGEAGLVRDLPGVDPSLVRALVDALESMEAGFARFAERLDAASVREHAFGKLIDAAKVRDAYHQRLPATKINVDEAAEVTRALLAEFGGRPGSEPPGPDSPGPDSPGPESPPDLARRSGPVPPQREAGDRP